LYRDSWVSQPFAAQVRAFPKLRTSGSALGPRLPSFSTVMRGASPRQNKPNPYPCHFCTTAGRRAGSSEGLRPAMLEVIGRVDRPACSQWQASHWVGMMRPRPWSAFATWLRRPLRRFVASLRKLAKQRVGPSRPASTRTGLVSKLRWPAPRAGGPRPSDNLHEQAAALQERLGHPDPGRQSACPCRACAGAPGPRA